MKIEKVNIPILSATFFVSLCCLGFEVSITRIFSLIFSHYCIFLTLSVAMFGLGIGGLFASLLNLRKKKLTYLLLSLALSFPISILIPFKIVFFLSHPLLLSILFFPPFLLAGLFVASVFKLHCRSSGFVYFADLFGASLGALLSVFLLYFFSPINVIFVYSFFILLATIFLSHKAQFTILQLMIIIFLSLNKNHTVVDVPYRKIPDYEGAKLLITYFRDEAAKANIERTYWSPSFRTDILYDSLCPNVRGIFVDGGTPTIMFGCDKDLNSISWLTKTLSYMPFLLAERDMMLSIGPGGGLDIILGLLADFETIEAVEINSSILEVLKDYGEFNGNIIESDRLEFLIGEGRNYLKKSNKSYDLINLSLVQINASSKIGLPLLESYLHTTDAFVDYLSHLKPNGCVAVTCETDHFLQRTIFNALFALKETGKDFTDAKNHIIVINNLLPSSPYRHLLLLKKDPFTLDQVNSIWEETKGRKLIPGYFPYLHQKMPVAFLSTHEIRDFLEGMRSRYKIDVSPTTDERPFFYDLSLRPPLFLYLLCLSAFMLSLFLLVFVKDRKSLSLSPHFFLLGTGFMLIEVSLVQKFLFFLGYPLTTFTVILFSLLLGCGLGGFLTQKVTHPFRKLTVFLLVICLLTLILFVFLKDVFILFFSLSDVLRTFFSFSVLLPFGIFLGMPLPILIREVGTISSKDVGLMWGVNGLMAVFGSSLSMIMAKTLGCKYSLFGAFLIYLCVLVLIKRNQRE